MSGALVLVATPIGNMGDLSSRARDALATADVIACEDTRRTGRLLELSGVGRRPLLVVNDHTEATRVQEVVERVGRGERVAVVSDAGMPGISDPGERLARAVAAAGHPVEVIPGPSAVVAALVVSGLPAGRFVYEGFLPRKGSGRAERLDALAGEARTAVLYEAPHRLVATLRDLAATSDPSRPVVLVRELTKLHEEVWRGSLADAIQHVTEHEPRGEYVIVLGGVTVAIHVDDETIRDALERARADGSSTKDAVAVVTEMLGVSKRRVYALATEAPTGPGSAEPAVRQHGNE